MPRPARSAASGNTATLSTTGAPAGSITVTCTVQDDKGQTATCTASVNVEAPPPPPAPKTKTLCSINFDRDKRRPARVDNEAKACLDDVALNLQQQTDASAVLVGEAASDEKKADTLAAQRAVNTKDYLVKEKGIDPSRISVRTGTQGNKEVENYLVPAGATFDNDVHRHHCGRRKLCEGSSQNSAAAPTTRRRQPLPGAVTAEAAQTGKGDQLVMVTLFIVLDPAPLAGAGWSPDNLVELFRDSGT